MLKTFVTAALLAWMPIAHAVPPAPPKPAPVEHDWVMGLRNECKPPIAPEHNGSDVCMFDQKHPKGIGCCGYGSTYRDEDDLWSCVDVLCQVVCGAPWKLVKKDCTVIDADVPEL